MANSLDNLIPDVYAALDVVGRELVGFIPAISRDSTADRLALGQTLRSVVTQPNTAGFTIVPGMALPSQADQTLTDKNITITNSKAFPFSWSGEDEKAIDSGPGFLTVQQDQIAQALRAAVNSIEASVAVAAQVGATRATGTAGTTPFATTVKDTANLKKILDDNGTPQSDRHLIIDTTAGAAMRSLYQLSRVNEAGDSSLLRQGVLVDLHNFAIRESAQVSNGVAVGTGANYVTNGVQAKGSTSVVIKTGTGTVLAGDVVTFAADPNNQYVVGTGVAAAGTIVLNAPGLRVAIPDGNAMTIVAAATRNLAFSRNAILLATRLPALPKQGDMAIDRETVTDPMSGLVFEIAVYPGFRMVTYHVSIAWGVSVIKNEFLATLLG